MYDGHIVPSRVLRQAPTPLHASTARPRPPSAPKSKIARRLGRAIGGAIAQMRRDRRRVDDPAGVEEGLRVEGALHGAKRLVQRRAEHLLVECAAHQAVAVLARQRAAELQHQIGDVVGNRLELRHAGRGLEVDDRAHVQAADRGVRVDAGDGAVAGDQLLEARDVVAQPLGRHRGVLDERDRLGVALHRHRQPERRLAHVPHPRLRRRVDQSPQPRPRMRRWRGRARALSSRGSSASR